ncbi:uncharacterized protein LOC117644856 isoform X2 [Thrips palmi]|uniref:Uncharacterized protein LOC117644856 isoform X2 n=1 Tax=Thrips palmi TaxID=161013 RepID=A0A6P8Z1E2_THRPL|nr:uncharacterized protein LOC117644856 isoform X2 [Thrips palmi]
MKMECHVCLEPFDSTERRPKVLPCGHSFCFRCLQGLEIRKCPLDNKRFQSLPSNLPDNYSLIQFKPVDTTSLQFWCQSCQKTATQECVENHSVCSLKKVRAEEAGQLLEALQRDQAAVDEAFGTLEDLRGQLEALHGELEKKRVGLVAAEWRLQTGQGADEAAWESAKQDAAQAAPLWQERSNREDREMTVEEMAAVMVAGSRVARGRDWPEGAKADGTPPGPGTVVAKVSSTQVSVKWDRTGQTHSCSMGNNGKYHLRLLPPVMVPYLETLGGTYDMASVSSSKEAGEVVRKQSFEQAVGLQCTASPTVSLTVLQLCAARTAPVYSGYSTNDRGLRGLHLVSPQQQHLEAALAMPRLQALSITNVTSPQLQQVMQLASLQRLEVHCPFDAPLTMFAPLATPARPGSLRWLRCGVHPLVAALDLVRAHADSLEELQLVAASTEPYGCPDLARQLRSCGLKKLKRLALLRHDAYDGACRHDKESCSAQMKHLCEVFAESNPRPVMLCGACDRVV